MCVGCLWGYLSGIQGNLQGKVFRCVWGLSGCSGLSECSPHTIFAQPWKTLFFTCNVWDIKISKCPNISFLKITGVCQLFVFWSPPEANYKTQSLGSACTRPCLWRESKKFTWEVFSRYWFFSMLLEVLARLLPKRPEPNQTRWQFYF